MVYATQLETVKSLPSPGDSTCYSCCWWLRFGTNAGHVLPTDYGLGLRPTLTQIQFIWNSLGKSIVQFGPEGLWINLTRRI